MAHPWICEQEGGATGSDHSPERCRCRYRAAFDRLPQRAMEHQRRCPPLLVSRNQFEQSSAAHLRRRAGSACTTSSPAARAIGARIASGLSAASTVSRRGEPATTTKRLVRRPKSMARLIVKRVSAGIGWAPATAWKRCRISDRSSRASETRVRRSGRVGGTAKVADESAAGSSQAARPSAEATGSNVARRRALSLLAKSSTEWVAWADTPLRATVVTMKTCYNSYISNTTCKRRNRGEVELSSVRRRVVFGGRSAKEPRSATREALPRRPSVRHDRGGVLRSAAHRGAIPAAGAARGVG
jgi:hypothetical protein